MQLGDWRIGEPDKNHLSVSHVGGKTSFIYKRDSTAHPGPRDDFGTWNFNIGTVLQGSTEGCATLVDAYFTPQDVSPAKAIIEFNRDLSDAASILDSFKIYDVANPSSEVAIKSANLKSGDSSKLELVLSTPPSNGTTYQVTNTEVVPTSDPVETVAAGAMLDIATTSWDYIQIQNWRLARVCENCAVSHFSVSSEDDLKTSHIFTSRPSQHRGPRSDYNGWNTDILSGPTYSSSGGIQFGNLAVQVRDWRIRQIDDTHLSISSDNGKVARIYRADGTVHSNVDFFSGYKEELGEPMCAFLSDRYLQIGDWRFGSYDTRHFSVTHRLGKTARIYTNDGVSHPGPRTDFSAWSIPDGAVIMGTNEGCSLFG